MNHIICLPVEGSPYLVASVEGDNNLKVLQKCVDGRITTFPGSFFRIHPMFYSDKSKSDLRWNTARQLLTSSLTKVYVNEDGVNCCSPNIATIITDPQHRPMGCPHLLGNICLVVPDAVMTTLGINVLSLKRK